MRVNLRILLISILVLSIVPVALARSEEKRAKKQAKKEAYREQEKQLEELRGIPENWKINLGSFLVEFDTELRLDSGIVVGSIINAENTLNLASKQSSLRLDAHYRFSPKRRIEMGYFALNRDATNTLTEDVQWGDVTFKANALVDSEFDTAFLKAAYRWSFVNKGRIDTGFSAGLSFLELKANVAGFGEVVDSEGNTNAGFFEEGIDQRLPVPVLGQFLDLTLTKKLFYRGSVELFFIDTSDWSGSMVDLRMALDYYFTRHFGIGLGYNFIRIEYEQQSRDDQRFNADYRISGAMAYLTFTF